MNPAYRLAICVEGNTLQAFIAEPGTMAGAGLVGTINKTICDKESALYARWQQLMTDAVMAMTQRALGAVEVKVLETELPLSERIGNC